MSLLIVGEVVHSHGEGAEAGGAVSTATPGTGDVSEGHATIRELLLIHNNTLTCIVAHCKELIRRLAELRFLVFHLDSIFLIR